jgi:hypothetical protein
MFCWRPIWFVFVLLTAGCVRSGSIEVSPVALSARKPANVAMVVVVNRDGRGVTYLTARDFQVSENDVALDSGQIGLRLLPVNSVMARRVALLVDMSRPLDDAQRSQLFNGLALLVGKLRHRQAVSLYAFDGSEHVQFVAEFPRNIGDQLAQTDLGLAKLLQYHPRDRSSSLHSAIMDTAGKLDHTMASEKQPLRRGTVIIIAQNPDLAGRVSEPEARQFVEKSPHNYFLLTVGQWATQTDISWLGKTQALQAASFNTMSSSLDAIADSVETDVFHYYVVSYCSPARSGMRRLTLRVTASDDKGQKQSGSYDTTFEATDFGPKCHSSNTPSF